MAPRKSFRLELGGIRGGWVASKAGVIVCWKCYKHHYGSRQQVDWLDHGGPTKAHCPLCDLTRTGYCLVLRLVGVGCSRVRSP
eukprot:1159247-Pelagomonas_calceolata.AAC.1